MNSPYNKHSQYSNKYIAGSHGYNRINTRDTVSIDYMPVVAVIAFLAVVAVALSIFGII